MITLMIDNKKYTPEWVEFSDGALTCKINDLPEESRVNIIFINICPKTKCSIVYEELSLVMDVLYENYRDFKVELNLPYLPYARADKVFQAGNPNPLQVFLYKLWSYNNIICINIADIHNRSVITSFKIDSIINEKSQLSCFKGSLHEDTSRKQWAAVIAPDKGAKDKAHTIADHLGVPLICADKKRDVSTGRIIETVLPDFYIKTPNPRVLICDDLLDGGGTFLPLCEKLKERGYIVDLYVTHLIAAKGLDMFEGLVDNIYYYQVVGNYINDRTVLDFNYKQ